MLASVKVRAFFILPAWMKGLRPWTVSRMARKRSRTRSSKSSGRRNNRRTSRKRRRETQQMTEQQETALTRQLTKRNWLSGIPGSRSLAPVRWAAARSGRSVSCFFKSNATSLSSGPRTASSSPGVCAAGGSAYRALPARASR